MRDALLEAKPELLAMCERKADDGYVSPFKTDWEKIKEVWANGTDFDLVILRNAFERTGIRCPWAYYKGRDYRTVRKLFPQAVLNECTVEPRIKHDAFEDATSQALTLQRLLQYMTKERIAT
jgi:hypothetical protein